MLLLENIVDWQLFTINTTRFIKGNLGGTLSSRTLFSSILPVLWCKSARLVHIGSRIGARWLASSRNVCTLRSYVDWLVPTTDDRLLHWTNTGSIPLRLYVPDCLKHSKSWDDKHTNCPLSNYSNLFPTSAKFISFGVVGNGLSSFCANAY